MATWAVRERPPPAAQSGHREGIREDAEGEEAGEHHRRAEEGVDEELDSGLAPVLVAPDAHEEVHRDQRDLEEDVEEDQVLRGEHPEHPELGYEQDGEVLLEVTRTSHDATMAMSVSRVVSQNIPNPRPSSPTR